MNRIFTLERYFVLVFSLIFSLLLIIPLRTNAQEYTRITNLPAIYIETDNRVGINSKEVYVNATLWYVDESNVVTRFDSVSIRGRGNSTWNLPKKPYRIKFNSKEKFLGKGYAKAKSWTLLANAADKTMIRNAVTSVMGEFLGLDFNPAHKFVDMTLNGTYIGTYQISDQVEVRAHRVDVEEQDYPLTDTSDISGGYLLEVDGFYDGNYFVTSSGVPIRIHYPDEDEIEASQNRYIKDYVQSFETALFSSDFDDAEKGYRPYVDSVSLIDWYIATEVSANIDGFYSTYFYKHRSDPKLYWGPLWDYDIAYANDTRKGDTSKSLMINVGYGETAEWVNQMWKDSWFANKVIERYDEVVANGLEQTLLDSIDSFVELLERSQTLNYERWGINVKVYNERVLYSSYDQYISDLKNFITTHIAYLSQAFAALKPLDPTPPFVAQNYFYRIINANTTGAMDVVDQSAEEGALICGWTNTSDRLSQEWQIKPYGDYYQIINRNGGMALNDPTTGNISATTNIGTKLNTALPDSLDDRQLWTIEPQGTAGSYNLINKYTQHTASLVGGTSNGRNVLSYITDDKNSTQKTRLWYIVAGDTITEDNIPNSIETPEPDEYALAYNSSTHILHFGAEYPEQLVFTATVYNTEGKQLRTFRADEKCDVTDLNDGVYIVRWKCGGKVRSAKFAR